MNIKELIKRKNEFTVYISGCHADVFKEGADTTVDEGEECFDLEELCCDLLAELGFHMVWDDETVYQNSSPPKIIYPDK